MANINPAALKYIIDGQGVKFNRSAVDQQLSTQWKQFNQSGLKDQRSAAEMVKMTDPRVNPFAANYVLATLGTINRLTDFSLSFRPKDLRDILQTSADLTKELALHRLGCENPGLIVSNLSQVFGSVTDRWRGIYFAALRNQYQPNPAWLDQVHSAIHNILLESAGAILQQGQKHAAVMESTLAVIAINSSQPTFEAVIKMAEQADPEMALRLRRDRSAYLSDYVYHYTRAQLLPSIAQNGLSAKFAPAGSECPDFLCFSNHRYAGIPYLFLGIEGYHVQDYLLRVNFKSADFTGGTRPPIEELRDLTGDYLLDKSETIAPEKIAVVNPQFATRAVPLIV